MQPFSSRWQVAADLVDPPEVRYRSDPVAWFTEVAGAELWSKQREIIEAVRDYPRVAVKSCHEVGKSFSAGGTVAWWLSTHPIGEAVAVTTAPTYPQVQAILWKEINGFHERAGLAGRVNLTEWYFGNYLAGLGRKPSEHNPAAFHGIHARYPLVVLDEAYGIPKQLWDAASTLGTNVHARMLAIGNPDGPGEFAEVCRPDSGWHVITISAFDTPNFTDERVSEKLAEMLIHPGWVEERARKWGTDSALYQSKVLGEFPSGGDPFAVMRYDWLRACQLDLFPLGLPIEAGIDVGAGGDRTVIRERRGRRAGREEEFVDADPMRTVARLAERLRDWDVTRVKVDSTGLGWALAGRLRELSSWPNPLAADDRFHNHAAQVVAVNFGAGPTEGLEHQYLNMRAELWWHARELSRPDVRTWDLTDVEDDVIAELVAPRYEQLDSFGKIKIEPKREVIKRLGVSPDRADALILAFHEGSSGVAQTVGVRRMTETTLVPGWSGGRR